MTKPNISSFLSSQSFASTPMRSEIVAEYVYDRPLKQHVWKFSCFVAKEFVPVDAFGYITELENSPRNTKESLFIIKVLANPATVDSGGSAVSGAIGHVGIDELEKTDDFTDVIRVTAIVGQSYGNAPSSYTYKSAEYTLGDYQLLNEDDNHKRLIAVYQRAARTENHKRWDSSFGGALLNITRTGSFSSSSPTVNYQTVSAELEENTDGTFTTITASNPGSWPILNSKETGMLDGEVSVSTQVVESGSTTRTAIANSSTLTKVDFKAIDAHREQKITTVEPLEGPVLTQKKFDTETKKLSTITKQVVSVDNATVPGVEINYLTKAVTIVETEQLDTWRKLLMTSELDMSGMVVVGTNKGFYRSIDGYVRYQRTPIVTGYKNAFAHSTLGNSEAYDADVAYEIVAPDKVYPASYVRVYATDVNMSAALTATLTALSASLLDNTIESKVLGVHYAYWGAGAKTKYFNGPQAHWSPAITSQAAFEDPTGLLGDLVYDNNVDNAMIGRYAAVGKRVVNDVSPKEWVLSLYYADLLIIDFTTADYATVTVSPPP
jgi:hypothetical protein